MTHHGRVEMLVASKDVWQKMTLERVRPAGVPSRTSSFTTASTTPHLRTVISVAALRCSAATTRGFPPPRNSPFMGQSMLRRKDCWHRVHAEAHFGLPRRPAAHTADQRSQQIKHGPTLRRTHLAPRKDGNGKDRGPGSTVSSWMDARSRTTGRLFPINNRNPECPKKRF
jgi:hypothetical protein